MLKDLIRKIKRKTCDNRGSAIVLVIIALAMVGVLAATIMWMSMTNYYMKATDKGNKQGFYSSETVLEQIKSGIEEDASLAASRAYAYILTKDYQADSTADRNYDFKKKFIDYFVDIVCVKNLGGTSDKGKYSVAHLQSFVDAAIQPSLSRQTTGTVRYLSTSPDGGGTLVDDEGNLLHGYDVDVIKLQGLHLEFTDRDNRNDEFVSIIDTDILVSIPDVSFTQTATLPDVFAYALVANKKLDLRVNGKTQVEGSIYAGEEGMSISDELKISKADRIISKGDVLIGVPDVSLVPSSDSKIEITGKTSGATTEFWANDIRLGNKVALTTTDVSTYVADDLTLSGRKATVSMTGAGSYMGYGSSDTDASDSSAIVINGIGSTVDMDALASVSLLGRSFVSVPHQTPDPLAPGGVSHNSIDFAMGESIAVKGEQIAFLVPDTCLSYVETYYPGTASENRVSYKLSNPFMTSSTYNESNLKVNLSDFSAYVSPTGYKVIKPSGVGGLAYVYMTMDGEKANDFYEAYYKNNKDRLNNYFLVYSGTGKVEVPAADSTHSEGSFITALNGYSSSNPDKIIASTDSQLNLANKTADKTNISTDLKQEKTNLCAKLIKSGATSSELSRPLFDNLIRRSDVEDLLTYNSGVFEKNGYKAVFVKPASGSAYDYTDTSIRVLVVLGDVNIKADFTGLLIADGTVNIGQNVKVTSIVNAGTDDMQRLKDALQVKENISYVGSSGLATEERSALMYFVDGSAYDLDGLQAGSSTVSANRVDFTELVRFNNWVKK